MSGVVQQSGATRNQSTAVISDSKRIFIFDNRYKEGIYKNNAGAAADFSGGMLVVRDTAVANGFLPATSANLADVVGVSAYEGTVSLPAAGTTNVNICTKGTIDGTLLVLPATVTLNTAVGNKTLTDVLEDLGLHVDTSAVENTKIEL